MNSKYIYLDNAATSWPKPPDVIHAMTNYMVNCGSNAGRGAHELSLQASREVFYTRNLIANLFGANNPTDIVFTMNTTHALNLAIQGFLHEEDHVICTNIEHNSVIRPLEYLKNKKKISISFVQIDGEGNINIKEIEEHINRKTKLLVINHSSNLLGNILPLSEFAEICKKHKIKLLVDAAQTAGILPIDVNSQGIDMLAFPGHKGLLGPQGTGGLYVSQATQLKPIIFGGTGSFSESIEQPNVRPDCFESGTLNTVGIVGLGKGVQCILTHSLEKIHQKEWIQTQMIMESLLSLKKVRILGPGLGKVRMGVVSFVIEDRESSEVAFILDKEYHIAVRAGLHCSPLAHKASGTLYTGAVRASVGFYTTDQELDQFNRAIKEIVNSRNLRG